MAIAGDNRERAAMHHASAPGIRLADWLAPGSCMHARLTWRRADASGSGVHVPGNGERQVIGA